MRSLSSTYVLLKNLEILLLCVVCGMPMMITYALGMHLYMLWRVQKCSEHAASSCLLLRNEKSVNTQH